jgi:hypothetical protein
MESYILLNPMVLFFSTIYKISVNHFNKKREPILNVLHLESDKERNEKLIIPMMIVAILVAFLQVSAEKMCI